CRAERRENSGIHRVRKGHNVSYSLAACGSGKGGGNRGQRPCGLAAGLSDHPGGGRSGRSPAVYSGGFGKLRISGAGGRQWSGRAGVGGAFSGDDPLIVDRPDYAADEREGSGGKTPGVATGAEGAIYVRLRRGNDREPWHQRGGSGISGEA